MSNLKNILITSLATAAVCLTACISFGSDDSERAHKERPLVSSMTITPEVPDRVSFCNEEIDMTRYDRHEALDRDDLVHDRECQVKLGVPEEGLVVYDIEAPSDVHAVDVEHLIARRALLRVMP